VAVWQAQSHSSLEVQMPDPVSSVENRRLAALRDFGILDTPPDPALDRITALAACHFGTPTAALTLVDDHRVWCKSAWGLAHCNLDGQDAPRTPGLDASAILSDAVHLLEDASRDPAARTHPFVQAQPGVRFYAAAPLITGAGYRIGALSILDVTPRTFETTEGKALEAFARIAMDQIELRHAAPRFAAQQPAQLQTRHTGLVTVCAWTKSVRSEGQWISFDEYLSKHLGLSVTHGIHPSVSRKIQAKMDHLLTSSIGQTVT